MLKNNKKFLIFCEELFYIFSLSLVVFSVLEFFYPRIVLAYLNMNILLLAWLINGIVILFINKKLTNE